MTLGIRYLGKNIFLVPSDQRCRKCCKRANFSKRLVIFSNMMDMLGVREDQ